MWPNLQFPADSVTFTEEILNGKLYFCAVFYPNKNILILRILSEEEWAVLVKHKICLSSIRRISQKQIT